MKRSLKLAWRIGLPHYESDEVFGRLMGALLDRRRGILDEAALFDSSTHHLYIPLDVYSGRAELMQRRLRELKRAGVRSTGINVLATIGHINEAWSYMPPLPFQPMIDHNGVPSTGCACPNTPEMRTYVKTKYALVAQAGPDFVWVDDDIRMHHHGGIAGGAWNCFCPTCLAIFARSAGRTYSRRVLVKALNSPKDDPLRRLWVDQSIETIRSLLADVEQAVHAVDRRIILGLMTAGASWTTYSGQAFDTWFGALGARKARPGGGFYSDETPIAMYGKCLDVGMQRAHLPVSVKDVQYELENFPYQALKKARSTTLNECTMALAAGLNGIAFNVLGLSGQDYEPVVEAVAPARRAWEELVAHAGKLPTCGLWPAWSPKLMARRAVRPGETWLGFGKGYDILQPKVLGEIGLPLSVDAPGCGTVLAGRIAEAFDDEQLRTMLAGGVLMDSDALEVLHARGLGELAGVRIARRADNGMIERLTDDELNGADALSLRDARIEFWGDATGQADVLEPTRKNVRVLARMEDFFGRDQGPCMTAFENALGGRVVVMGYAQWIFIHSAAKRRQLQNVADWVTRGRLPVRISPTVRLIPMVRFSANRRRGAIVLLNAGNDPIDRAEIEVRAPRMPVRTLLPKGDKSLPTRQAEGGFSVPLRSIGPWTTTTLLLG